MVLPVQAEVKRGRGQPKGRQFIPRTDFGDLSHVEDLNHYYFKSECHDLRWCKARHQFARYVHKLSFRQWLEHRDRARKDLFWLGKDCIGTEESGANFSETVHREMCAMFVPKDFDGVYHKDYTLTDVRRNGIGKQKREKEMLLLAPRKSYKSTTNKIDCVQWMLNVPDIRILIMTGAFNLAVKFLKEVKGFFFKPPNEPYTFFQSLFPEYILSGIDGESAAPLFCPARVIRQGGNPTLWVNSIVGAVAGWHCDVMKGDDIVNEDNSNNEDTREKLKDRYDNVSGNLPDEWAFRDHLGTRYYEDDWYGERIKILKKYGDSNSLKFLKRSSWTVRPGFEQVPIRQLQEHMVDLYFPEKLTFQWLIGNCRQNEKEFRCQQLNEPAAADVAIDFDEDVLNDHKIISTKVPRPAVGPRRIACCWDTAHTDTMASDYSAGAVGYCHEEKRSLYVLEVLSGKWKDSDLAKQVVDLHMRWNPFCSELERFPSWELLAAEIQRYAFQKYGKTIALSWRDVDNTPNAKRNRVKGLESLLSDDRLWFVDGDWIELTFQQFTRFTGLSKKRKDDIPDAISFLQRLVPYEQHEEADDVQETIEQRKEREKQEMIEKFQNRHRDSAYTVIFQAPAPPPAPEPVSAPVDPGPARIFGDTGIHL